MHSHNSSIFNNHVTLTFELLISGSVHAEWLSRTVCQPSLMLIARVIFLLKLDTDRQTHSHKCYWSPKSCT